MDQAAGLRNLTSRNRAKRPAGNSGCGGSGHQIRVISVTSGKGGVGKTNVVANLAYAFNEIGKRVLVLDADLGLGNMDVMLGLNPRYTIGHVLNGEKTLDEVILNTRADSSFSLPLPGSRS